jgi:hypothetical protein
VLRIRNRRRRRDPHHFGKLDPDPHQSGKLVLDHQQSGQQDPDQQQNENMEAFENHFRALVQIWKKESRRILIRIRVKGRIRISIKVKSRIRIRTTGQKILAKNAGDK